MKKSNLFHESLQTILEHSHPLTREQISFQEAQGRILAEDVIAMQNDPPAAKSAMDGYSLCAKDTHSAHAENPVELPYSGVLAAGHLSSEKISPGRTLKIMTGALLPAGADAVVKQEDIQVTQKGTIVVKRPLKSGDNVLQEGSHQKKGDLILLKGGRVTPQMLGMLAKLGKVDLQVYRRPHVALLAIGDELVQPGKPLQTGQLRVSNLYSLSAAVERYGGISHRLDIARDDPEHIEHLLRPSLEDMQPSSDSPPYDIIVTLGGSLRGDFDFAHTVLEKLGASIHFRRTEINLGPSTIFATRGNQLFFALPGTPVPSWAAFELLARPALWKMAGRIHLKHSLIQARLNSALTTKGGRLNFFPGWLTFTANGPPRVSPLKIRQTDSLPTSLLANSLIHAPAYPLELEEGTMVKVAWTGGHCELP